MFKDLKGKTAIITGARRGMGRSHALKLAEHGVKVTVADISKEDCQKVVDEIENKGGEAMAVKCDVTDKSQVEEMVQKTVDEFGSLDILVNNAGIAQFKPFEDMTEEDWKRTIDINLNGYFRCAKEAIKHMLKQDSGSIINIASIAMGQTGVGFSHLAHYCASKGGIVGMTEELALEFAKKNIRVNAISPGIIETPMIDPITNDPDQKQKTLSQIPMGRVGKPEEVSNMVVFLASDASSYMTGSDMVIDGGWLSV